MQAVFGESPGPDLSRPDKAANQFVKDSEDNGIRDDL
jgi:hypothetical protein